jgi:hypothetical protein
MSLAGRSQRSRHRFLGIAAIGLCGLVSRQSTTLSQVAHSPSRIRACGNGSGSGSRMQPNRGQADALPQSEEGGALTSQILGQVARHDVRRDSSVQIVFQPQLTPPFLHAWLRILCADSFEKCFDGQLSAISRCDCSRHTARPRTRWNYGRTLHRESLNESSRNRLSSGDVSCRSPPTLGTMTAARSQKEVARRIKGCAWRVRAGNGG